MDKYDCYNKGISYLKKTLGLNDRGNYNTGAIIPYSSSHEVHLLLGQYYCGRSVRRDLYYKLLSLGCTM